REVRVVGARHDGAVERHLVGEVDERLLEVVEAAVVLEMLVVDVRNHRNRRKQFEERPIALVRFSDHQLAAAEPRIAAERAQPPAATAPPMTAVGSRPARSSTSAIIDVVVVFPCAPATAIAKRSRISSASISARGMTGTWRRSASTTSGFVRLTADEITTTSTS